MSCTTQDVLHTLRADGPLIRAADAVREAGLPRVDASTVIRWILRGCRGVRLQAIRLGGCWHTTVPAVERFVAAQQPDPSVRQPEPPAHAAQRRRAVAKAELAARGMTSGSRSRRR